MRIFKGKNGNAIQATALSTNSVALTDGVSTVFQTEYDTLVRIAAVTEAYVLIGPNVTTADTDSAFFPEGMVEWLVVPKMHKIAVSGTVTLTEGED